MSTPSIRIFVLMSIAVLLLFVITKEEHLGPIVPNDAPPVASGYASEQGDKGMRYWSCTQMCDEEYPGLLNDCQIHGGVNVALSGVTKSSPECDLYYQCVGTCRKEQEREIKTDPGWSPYQRLDDW